MSAWQATELAHIPARLSSEMPKFTDTLWQTFGTEDGSDLKDRLLRVTATRMRHLKRRAASRGVPTPWVTTPAHLRADNRVPSSGPSFRLSHATCTVSFVYRGGRGSVVCPLHTGLAMLGRGRESYGLAKYQGAQSEKPLESSSSNLVQCATVSGAVRPQACKISSLGAYNPEATHSNQSLS